MVNMPKPYIYESYGDTLIFAEDLGWIEPEIDIFYLKDGSDALEDDALAYIELNGYVVSYDEYNKMEYTK